MNTMQALCIKLVGQLDKEDYEKISALARLCGERDHVALKLELDYKLAAATGSADAADADEINEFMAFDGETLVGYIGLCAFGGASSPFEATGMAHPDYRRRGIFTALYERVIAECARRKSAGLLLLCDGKSAVGQAFIKKTGGIYRFSEYEMYLKREDSMQGGAQLCGVSLHKATNADAREVARQNAIYWGGSLEEETASLLPEEEEKRGLVIYLAKKGDEVVGKVHLQNAAGTGGIYGLGVLPEQRGKRYGRAILLLAIEKLREAGAREIMLQVEAKNATALTLYQSCGFSETSTMDYFEMGY